MTAWRGFICNADYMFVISDVVLTQSVASRWMHRKEYPLFARGIEQGRYCGADILATLHALDGLFDYNLVYCSYAECCAIIDQAKGVPQAAERTKNQTGDEIQSRWRGCSQTAKYCVMVCEKDAATFIQSHWRRFVQFSKFLIALDSSITTIPATFRCFGPQRCCNYSAVLVLQCVFRVFAAKTKTEVLSITRMLE
jgi:hypothetical protein